MTSDEIIAIAKSSGISAPREIGVNDHWMADDADLIRFAEAVVKKADHVADSTIIELGERLAKVEKAAQDALAACQEIYVTHWMHWTEAERAATSKALLDLDATLFVLRT